MEDLEIAIAYNVQKALEIFKDKYADQSIADIYASRAISLQLWDEMKSGAWRAR